MGKKSKTADYAIQRAIERINFFRTCIRLILLHFAAEQIIWRPHFPRDQHDGGFQFQLGRVSYDSNVELGSRKKQKDWIVSLVKDSRSDRGADAVERNVEGQAMP